MPVQTPTNTPALVRFRERVEELVAEYGYDRSAAVRHIERRESHLRREMLAEVNRTEIEAPRLENYPAVRLFSRVVESYAREHGCERAEAARAVSKAHPNLHARVLAESNAGNEQAAYAHYDAL
jgi:DNA-binding LacI/PurR family transcriptional regulator